jgi:hypothetical protein
MPRDANQRHPHIGRAEHRLDRTFWETRYATGETDWDKNAPSPGLLHFLAHHSCPPGRVLVPGCGRGHDARALGRAGFRVDGLDISARAVRDAAARARAEGLDNVRFIRGDFFGLPDTRRGRYDWIFEHTFFCAIDPALRDRYVAVAARLLRRRGRLLGVFYNIQPDSGPPFGLTRAELLERFGPRFQLRLERVPPSWPHRAGRELLMLFEKRAATRTRQSRASRR